MKLKQAILTIMDRDTLKAVVDDLEIEDVDRRNVEEMRARVSRSRRAAPEMLLVHLSEKQVKAVCEQISVSSKGRRKELMERLLKISRTGEQLPANLSLPRSMKTMNPNRKQAQKESLPMADKQNKDNQNEPQPAPVRLPDPPPGMMRVTRTDWSGRESTTRMARSRKCHTSACRSKSSRLPTRVAPRARPRKGDSSFPSSTFTRERRVIHSRRAGRISSSGATICW